MFKPDNITPPEQILKELNEIAEYTQKDCVPQGNALAERATYISNHIARSGKLLADAEYHLDSLISSEIIRTLSEGLTLPASVLKQFIDSSCKNYNYLVTLAERINRSCTHELDLLRSLISKEKAEMNNNF